MKKLPHINLSNRVFIVFTVSASLLVLLLTFLFLNSLSKTIRSEGERITGNTLLKSGKDLEQYIDQLQQLSQIMENTPAIQTYFSSKAPSDITLSEVEKLLFNVVSIKPDIVSIILVGRDGRLASNEKNLPMELSEDMMDMPWYKETLQNGGQPVLTSARMQDFSANRDSWVISMCREIKGQNGENLGLILIDLDYKVVENVLGDLDLGENGYLFVINDKNQPVYHKDASYFTDTAKTHALIDEARLRQDDSGGYVKQSYHLTNADWNVVVCASLDSINMIRRDTIQVVIISTAVLTILASISSWRIKRLMDDIKLKEHIQRETELSALQNQINPHFLYNSLDTIIWMAEFREVDKVIAITGALARFFRLSLNASGVTTFGNECEHVRQYLQIQRFRYEDLIKYEIDVNETLLSWKVPKLILQPIVENAIDHGLRGKKEGGTVRISADIVNGLLEVTVSDDGVGFKCEKDTVLPTQAMLLSGVVSDTLELSDNKKRSSGVGLKNVALRVRLFGGERCGVIINSQQDVGTSVKVVIRAAE